MPLYKLLPSRTDNPHSRSDNPHSQRTVRPKFCALIKSSAKTLTSLEFQVIHQTKTDIS